MSDENVVFEPVVRWGAFAMVALIVAVIAIFHPVAKPDPPNSAAYGCYITDNAPSILLGESGMSIQQRGFLGIPFHLERHKTAITLVADAPIRGEIAAGRYLYFRYHPGAGRFLDFQKIEGGRRSGQFDETKLTMFSMVADDGNEIIYAKAPLTECSEAARPLNTG